MASAKRPKVRVLFTDKDGREWEIFEHVVGGGLHVAHTPGEGHADYRTFVPTDGGNPKQYKFYIKDDSLNGGRGLSPIFMALQLEQAKEIQRKAKRAKLAGDDGPGW